MNPWMRIKAALRVRRCGARRGLWALALLAFGAAAVHAALGLSTTFVGASWENGVAVGTRNDLGALLGREFEVRNTSEREVTVRVEPEAAAPSMLLPGYESIPDAAWIRPEPSEFVLAPGESAKGKIYLDVPDDAALAGKRLQGALWMHTVGREAIQVGLRTRVPFFVGKRKP